MEFDAEEINLQVHTLPAVLMMECQLPKKIIQDLNTYLNVYKPFSYIFSVKYSTN